MAGESISSAKERVSAIKNFIQVNKDYNQLNVNGNSLEQDTPGVLTQLNEIKNDVKRFKREVKSQFEELLSFAQLGDLGSVADVPNPFQEQVDKINNSSSLKYLKTKLIQTLRKIEPEVGQILFEESLHAIGCSYEQDFLPNNPIWIPVKSIDLYEILKLSPQDSVGETFFERGSPIPGIRPFPLNKELWNRVQNANQLYSSSFGGFYLGGSGQGLFDIEYTQVGEFGQPGDFFKVYLQNRFTDINGVSSLTNRVGDFIADYYRSIRIFDFSAIFSRLIDEMMGVISIKLELGTDKIEDRTKFSLLIQRVLGLCFDGRNEIDVSGVAKVAELDGFDDSFFEFTDVDLRYVESQISNIQNKVAEFESCGDLKIPFDPDKILDSVRSLNTVDNQADIDNLADNITNVITDTLSEEQKKFEGEFALALSFPTITELSVDVNFNFIANLPKAFITSILSPKVILPIMIMIKAIQQLATTTLNQVCQSEINSMQDFFKCFKTFMKNLVSKIGGLFVRELFELIKKDIRRLISALIKDLAKEQATKKYAMILSLIQLLLIITSFVRDWRRCKSVIDELLALLDLGLSFVPQIPLPLLAASSLKQGYSSSRAMVNTIEELQKKGIPTGPMPDGSPNLFVQSMFSQLKGSDSERTKNGKNTNFVPSLAVSPAGFTFPTKSSGVPL